MVLPHMENVMNGDQDRTEDEKYLIESLREKIKAKMDVAKTFGAFFTGLLTAVIALISDRGKLETIIGGDEYGFCAPQCHLLGNFYRYAFFSSVIFIAIAVVLFFRAMYAYDRLLMPRYFWTEKRSVKDLYDLMSEAWNNLFNIAACLLAVGLLGFAVVLLRLDKIEMLVLVGLLGAAVLISELAVTRIRFQK